MFPTSRSQDDVHLCAPNLLHVLHTHMTHHVVPCRHGLLHQPTYLYETPLMQFYSFTSTQLEKPSCHIMWYKHYILCHNDVSHCTCSVTCVPNLTDLTSSPSQWNFHPQKIYNQQPCTQKVANWSIHAKIHLQVSMRIQNVSSLLYQHNIQQAFSLSKAMIWGLLPPTLSIMPQVYTTIMLITKIFRGWSTYEFFYHILT